MYFTHRFYMLLHLYVLHQFCSSICITSNFCSLKVIITVCNAFFQAYPSKTLEIICIECKYLNFSNHNLQLKSFILLIKQRTLKGIPWTSVASTQYESEYFLLCSNFASILKVLLALWIMDLEIVLLQCCSWNMTYFHCNINLRKKFKFYFMKQSIVNAVLIELELSLCEFVFEVLLCDAIYHHN